MKMTMTIEQFKEWAKTPLTLEQDAEVVGDWELNDGYDEDGDEIVKTHSGGFAWKAATDGTITVTRRWDFNFPGTQNERRGDAELTSPASDYEWEVDGTTILDEDGDTMGKPDVESLCSEVFEDHAVNDIDIENLIPAIAAIATTEIEMESDMEEHTVYVDNAPSIKFHGELVASVSNKQAYNGGGRWRVLRLFRTKGGKYICQSIGRTQWIGEEDRVSAAVCETKEDVIEFFGHTDLAKELYAETPGIDDSVTVE